MDVTVRTVAGDDVAAPATTLHDVCAKMKKRLSVDSPLRSESSQLSQRHDSLSSAMARNSHPPSRQTSQREMPSPLVSATATAEPSSADSVVQFLERRRSNDTNAANQRRHSYYSQIQPDLYRRRGSIISVASSFSSTHSISPSSASGTAIPTSSEKLTSAAVAILGRAQLQMVYDFSKSDFIIQLIEGSIQPTLLQLDDYQMQFSLQYPDVGETDNPATVKRRDVKKSDNAGHFTACGPSAKFPTSYEDLLLQVLTIALISTRTTPGFPPTIVTHAKASVALSLLNPSDDELLIWLDLEAVKEVEHSCGELNLCVQFLPSAARLTLTVHQATNLPVKLDRHPNMLVKAALIQDDKVLLKKRKTNTRKACAAPSWNEVLTFGVTQTVIERFLSDHFARSRLEVCVMECDRFGNNSRPIGQINFAATKQPSASGVAGHSSRVNIWRETIQGRNVASSQWFSLEPFSTT